jgi:hypothetical protein
MSDVKDRDVNIIVRMHESYNHVFNLWRQFQILSNLAMNFVHLTKIIGQQVVHCFIKIVY